MKIITIKSEAIEQFKASWPCHGLPDNVDLIVAAFAPNGDLVDYELSDAQDNLIAEISADGEFLGGSTRLEVGRDALDYIRTGAIDGAALSSLFDIAKEHAVENPIIPGTISSGYTLTSYTESV